jgi:all-trans-retinol dehydrogenase (NAD+)
LVLLTGAGGGIGSELAKKFAELGCRIILWDNNEVANEDTTKICREIGANNVFILIYLTGLYNFRLL